MIGVEVWQGILDALGWVLARLYDAVPNYGAAIILLTVGIRLLLVPLGVKQMRSMQALQAIQPKVKAVQEKYKGNRQKQNEEVMRLYKEHGVNPLAGCWPLLLQFPVLIALFAVLQFPLGLTHIPHSDPEPRLGIEFGDSRLYVDIVEGRASFLGMNLLCTPVQAGTRVPVESPQVPDAPDSLDCGRGVGARIPFYALAALMVGTTYYQSRQMQRATPGSAQQQQALTRVLPLIFGIWGFLFPAGLVLYWTTSNVWQIGQQHFMLRAGLRATAPAPAAATGGDGGRPGPRRGLWAALMERSAGSGGRRRPAAERPNPPRSSGERHARSRKKRRKR